MNKVMISVSVLVVALMLFASFVLADDNSSSNQTMQRNESVNKTKNWDDTCLELNGRIDGKLNEYGRIKGKHTSQFDNLMNVITKVKARADTLGVNTTQLDEDLAALRLVLEDYKADYAVFLEKLNDTKNFTCGHSQGRFLQALNESKAYLKVVREDLKQAKELFDAIKEDIKNLRHDLSGQKKELRNETREEKKNEMMEEKQERMKEKNDTRKNITQLREEALQKKLDMRNNKFKNDTTINSNSGPSNNEANNS